MLSRAETISISDSGGKEKEAHTITSLRECISDMHTVADRLEMDQCVTNHIEATLCVELVLTGLLLTVLVVSAAL